MKTEIHYCRKTLCGGENMTLDYYLTRKLVRDEQGSRWGFGVRIVRTTDIGGRETAESEKIDDIFCGEDDALRFVELISDNTVTPVGLRDVAEDYIVGQ